MAFRCSEAIKKLCFNITHMRLAFALLLAGILFFGFGCPSEEAPAEETPPAEGPQEETPLDEEPEEETPPEEPGEITECADGTPVGKCSITKPKVCDIYGNLIDDATTCGCPENSVQLGSECIYNCEDGTLIGSCSVEPPYYCNSQALLEEKASLCGCPPGYDAHGEKCRNACDDGTSKYSCSAATPPYYCNEKYELVVNPLVCGCHPWEFLLEGKCFDPSARQYSKGETIRVTEGLSMKIERASWEKCEDGSYVKLQLTFANAGKEDVKLENYNFKLFADDVRGSISRPSGCSIGHLFDWGTLKAGETESGQVWFKVTGGVGNLHSEYLHYYTPSMLKTFYIDLED